MLSVKNGFWLLAFVGLVRAIPANNKISPELEEFDNFNSTIDTCKRGCPRILEPICAVDETDDENIKYFHNSCLMKYDACRRGRGTYVGYYILYIQKKLLKCIYHFYFLMSFVLCAVG